MQHYYVEKQEKANGAHEIHVPRCTYLPEADDRIYLGTFTNCADALRAAQTHYDKAASCRWCCKE
ncbi:MAG TPA: hypothetical protein VJ652_05405 [Noviherbaspirillum sp.]|nr:hypothetical protein [Noviherbaspirillum sp.]